MDYWSAYSIKWPPARLNSKDWADSLAIKVMLVTTWCGGLRLPLRLPPPILSLIMIQNWLRFALKSSILEVRSSAEIRFYISHVQALSSHFF